MTNVAKSSINKVKKYIQEQWGVLTQDHKNLIETFIDSKLTTSNKKNKHLIYIAHNESLRKITAQLKKELSYENFNALTIKQLPTTINHHAQRFITKNPGLLYLPNAYISPGGRFNEMYGWDSYFIILGLLHNNRIEMAKRMTDNLIYEVMHYGKVLNANRSYFLTRSQPPLLSSMILAIYQKTKDKQWLQAALKANTKTYQYWVRIPRLVSSIGLSRFYAESEQPIPETEPGYYPAVKKFYRKNNIKAYNTAKFYNKRTNQLTTEFLHADRTIRESGFDLTNKYGPFGTDITSYIPIGLNSLLYKMEMDTITLYRLLGDKKKVSLWQTRAKKRAQLINQTLWVPELGFYFDYNHTDNYHRTYIYATTFYPLWAGVASQEQAARIVENLPALEAAGGILASSYVTGMQWDAPFGWAPHQFFAVRGLARYGYHKEAKRIAKKFITMLTKDFSITKKLYEKYDVRKMTSNIVAEIKYGYKVNVEGFGWTNAIYLDLLSYLNENKSG